MRIRTTPSCWCRSAAPNGPRTSLPFLENVTRGRGIPRERLAEVGAALLRFRWPEPDQRSVSQLARRPANRTRLGAASTVPLYWGNRNWDPYLDDALRQIEADGHRRVVASPPARTRRTPRAGSTGRTCTTPSRARGPVDKIRHYAHHPGFVAASVDGHAGGRRPARRGEPRHARLVFVTHAIPTAMAASSGPPPRSAEGGYVDWHRVVAAEVTRQVAAQRDVDPRWDLVYCSRSGPPSQPWTEPDVNDHLEALSADGSARRRAGADRLRLRPHGGHLRPRHRGGGHRGESSACRSPGPPRPAPTRPSFAALVDLIVERAEVARSDEDGAWDREPEGVPVVPRRARRTLRLPAVLLPESARSGPSGPVPGIPLGLTQRD